MKKRWMWVGGLVLALGISAPWVSGKLTEQQWQQAVAELNEAQPMFSLDTMEYTRGYLGSRLEGHIEFENPKTGEREVLGYRGDVSHGLVGSRIVFVTEVPEGEVWPLLFPQRQPELTLTTRLWGTARADMSMPAISLDDEMTGETLTVSEGYGWVNFSSGGSELEANMIWPGAVLRGPEYRLSMENLHFEQSMERLRGDVWIGSGEAVLASASLARADAPEVVLEDLRWLTESLAVDDDQRFTTRSILSLARISLDSDSFGPHQLEFALSDVSVDGWNLLVDAFHEMQAASEPVNGDASGRFERQLAATMNIAEAARALAGAGFSVGFPELSLDSPDGPVTGTAILSHPELGDAELEGMAIVMERLSGQLQLRIPVALTERYPALAEELAPLLAQGVLVRSGDDLVLEATLKDLQINLNGQVIPLPPMI